MLVIEHRDGAPAGAEHRRDLLEEPIARILHLPLGRLRIIAVFAHHHHSIHREFAGAARQRFPDGGVDLHGREARCAIATQIVGAHLVDVQRNQIHLRMMVRAVPAVSLQIPVDDVLRVRVLSVDGCDRGKLRTVTRHIVEPLYAYWKR